MSVAESAPRETAGGVESNLIARLGLACMAAALLTGVGYAQLNARQVAEAIALFKLNVEMYPNAFNTYDSLGEAYAAQGDRAAAIRNYRKSLALNPKNTNAVEMLKKLGATP